MKRQEEEKNEKKKNLEIDLTSSFNLIEWNKSTRINSRNSWTTFFDSKALNSKKNIKIQILKYALHLPSVWSVSVSSPTPPNRGP